MTSKPKTFRLWQEITLALALKAAALIIIWFVWFSAPEDQAVDARQVTSHLFPRHSAKE
jgi:hypothetical protein